MDHKKVLHELIQLWKDNKVFEKSIEQRPEELEIITYDGPPFASGTPHYGHGLVSIMKDALARYKTMQWYRVERKWWRDCHGLPVEKFVEKQLGIDGKKDIENKLGVEKFVEACRATVNNVNDEWRIFVDMVGRWADMDNAYFTMDLDFMESVMWVFSKMYKQNLVYKGFAIQWYCPSCATALSNSEINDGYKDRQDPAITVKFQVVNSGNPSVWQTCDGNTCYVQWVIKDENGRMLSLFNKKHNSRQFPGGKIEKWEKAEIALAREIEEELAVKATVGKHIGDKKVIMDGEACCIHLYEASITGEPVIQEKNKHAYIDYVELVEAENTRWYGYKVLHAVMTDDGDVMRFKDLLAYQQIQKHTLWDLPMHILAWTTTPWTLPSNMFLAVGNEIDYVQIFDLQTQEYYILAEALLSSYYKEAEQYVVLYKIQWKDLVGLQYKPLYDFYHQSDTITQEYKDKVHRVLAGSFVSTESGTGIVHIAPAFGQDDFEVVAQEFPRQDAKDWLFMPIDDYAEFTDAVAPWKGVRVYEANKDIIQDLKNRQLVVTNKTYDHSYPHCRRCDTPLIYRAMNSWFIKEQSIAQNTIPALNNITFVPETVRNRFRDVLKSAPDWNISRNRYRWAPIPVWESQDEKKNHIVVDNLETLFQYTKSGSSNITKNIFVRHGHAEHNIENRHETYGRSHLTQKGEKQASGIVKNIKKSLNAAQDFVIIVSPLRRTWQTMHPFMQDLFDVKTMKNLEKAYDECEALYRDLWDSGNLVKHVHSNKEKNFFHLGENVYVDFRITEPLLPELEWEVDTLVKEWTDQKFSPSGESMIDVYNRLHQFLCETNSLFQTQSVIIASHEDPIMLMIKAHRNFDFVKQHKRYLPSNASVWTHYWDNSRNCEVDLHKPYVDNYWFTLKDRTYKRISEVLDCWFESWSMPYGQVHYLGSKSDNKLLYPADFIIEWLDQTRGWFRTLHVLGQWLMEENAFNNVIINGLILASDGKKMSKKLKNYPDPQELFYKYGSDAFRMFVLSSPAVRAEPVRMWESHIEQTYKDFTAPLLNAYNFYSTYAAIDNFVAHTTRVYALADTTIPSEISTTDYLRMDLDVVVDCSETADTSWCTQVQMLYKTLANKKIIISHNCNLGDPTQRYESLLQEHAGKNVLIIAKQKTLESLRHNYYGMPFIANADVGVVPLPTYRITRDMDRWILAELHDTAADVESAMESYMLDAAANACLDFIEKLTNRYIRRSRRTFWASGMDADKLSAYNTIAYVLDYYVKLISPFAPFVSEHLWQDMHKKQEWFSSVHLQYMPVSCKYYVDQNLLQEIDLVRKIISLGLSLRSKHSIKIKQPLQRMDIALE